MSRLSKLKAQLPFGAGNRSSSDGEVSHPEKQKYVGPYDNSKVPILTIHSFIMGVFVSMGGFIFGYDTGQISGFLGMRDFQERFGQRNKDGSGYHFSNVRSGLIVALVMPSVLLVTVYLIAFSCLLVLSWELFLVDLSPIGLVESGAFSSGV